MATKAIVGEKVGMTQIWDDQNRVIPVTVVRIKPIRVVRVKTNDSDGYSALQVTFGNVKEQRLSNAERGVFVKADVEPGRKLVELRLDDVSGYEVAQEFGADVFEAGDKVDVTGISKGKGFAGGMKRHNFRGQGASHGNHKHHRAPGSVGATSTPGRVFKGWRMAGRMGHETVTTLSLTVAKVETDRELILIKGAIPGPKGGTVIIRNATKVPVAKAKK